MPGKAQDLREGSARTDGPCQSPLGLASTEEVCDSKEYRQAEHGWLETTLPCDQDKSL